MLLIIETHPIQYRTPIYQRLAFILKGAIHVVYASDFSVRGGYDPGFSRSVAWDNDLLSGYQYTMLNVCNSSPPWRWNDLPAGNITQLINSLKPKGLLINSLSYRYDWVAYTHAIRKRIPVWIRSETQDQAFERSSHKTALRKLVYKVAYSGIKKAFAIGELNRKHYLDHGLSSDRISYARYCTPDRVRSLSFQERIDRRQRVRQELGLSGTQFLVAFFGKLIPKKDPGLLISAAAQLPIDLQSRSALVFVGSGELDNSLQLQAEQLYRTNEIPTHFSGFINQTDLVNWYLAADVVVLPSRKEGETWGLVVNEALQAGCGVVVSESVGCSADFYNWDRVRTIPVGSSKHLALALAELSVYPRDFDWAAHGLEAYSIESAAQAFAAEFLMLK